MMDRPKIFTKDRRPIEGPDGLFPGLAPQGNKVTRPLKPSSS